MVIAITNRKLCKDDFAWRVRQLLSADPFAVILREKDLNDSEYKKLSEEIIENNNKYRKILTLNRSEIALKLGIENVHVSMQHFKQYGKPTGIKRTGVSVHSVEEALLAEKIGADYIIAGHIYATDCKKGVPPRGIDFFQNVCKAVKIPVFAVGGICEKNFHEPLLTGGAGVCLMSEFMTSGNPYERIKLYK